MFRSGSSVLLALALFIASLAIVPAADAIRFNFSVYENADDADVSLLDTWVDVVDGGSFVDFTFYNDSSTPANVAIVYFSNGLGLTNGLIQAESAGVDFRLGANPANPAQANNQSLIGWAGTMQAFGARPSPAHNGIGHLGNEYLTVRWSYDGTTYDDVLDGLNSGTFQLAQHITGLPQSVWSRSGPPEEPVPLPASLWLLGSGLAMAFGGRFARRRK